MTHTRKPCSRWKADTETAFVLALSVHGKVRDAAKTCGVSLAAAYKRRERWPAFARRWDEAVANTDRRGTAPPLPRSGPSPTRAAASTG